VHELVINMRSSHYPGFFFTVTKVAKFGGYKSS
jgi:hypothetical protein